MGVTRAEVVFKATNYEKPKQGGPRIEGWDWPTVSGQRVERGPAGGVFVE